MPRLCPSLLTTALMTVLSWPAFAEPVTVASVAITEWKAVYGTIEARDRIPARARLGGTLVELSVVEGDEVAAGQALARIVDDKLDFQLASLAAQRAGLSAQLANAEADLKRGEELLKNGVTTTQRVDALRTQVDVLTGQIAALNAQGEVVTQQAKEGVVLAPVAGRVLDVPVTKGAVVMPGEVVAAIGGGGTFLRIVVPERHAGNAGRRRHDPAFRSRRRPRGQPCPSLSAGRGRPRGRGCRDRGPARPLRRHPDAGAPAGGGARGASGARGEILSPGQDWTSSAFRPAKARPCGPTWFPARPT